MDEIVVAMDDRRAAFPMHEFLECRLAGIDILELPTFLERETGKVRLDVLNPSWIIFGEGFRASPLQRALERGFDVVASLGLLLIAAPFMLLAVLAIKLEDGWPRRSSTGSVASAATASRSTCSSSAAWASTRRRAGRSGP